MIVPTMTYQEVRAQVLNDQKLINVRYLDRYLENYDKMRRKNRINKLDSFPKSFEFRTPAKNSWCIVLKKDNEIEKYKGINSIIANCFIRVNTFDGYRIYTVNSQGKMVAYKSHFFKRYNERLGLNLVNPIDKVIHYFTFNYNSLITSIESPNKQLLVGKCRDGLILGEYQVENGLLLFRTFINNELMRDSQLHLIEEMREDLKFGIFNIDNQKYDHRTLVDIYNQLYLN